jgi:hypothetical protein
VLAAVSVKGAALHVCAKHVPKLASETVTTPMANSFRMIDPQLHSR